jgi:peptidoglycan/LPS O-acetylase OafA/YrhL
MLLELAVAVVFAFQRNTLGEVIFALWAVGTGVLLVTRVPFRIRLIARLYRSATIFLATSAILLIVAINFSTQSRWAEAAIFCFLAMVPAAVATTLIRFTRKANKTLRDRERSS